MKKVYFCTTGRLSYARVWAWQQTWCTLRRQQQVPDLLLLTEHPPTYTCGRSTRAEHLLYEPEELAQMGCEFFEIERGGSVTFHGPGQLVGYPLVDLHGWGRDVHRHMRRLEEVVVRTLAAFGLSASPGPELTGVWVGQDKIAAIGVHVRHWITMHGFALNVCPDLTPFAHILPCGLDNDKVTSMAQLLQEVPLMERIEAQVRHEFAAVFEVELEEMALGDFCALVEPGDVARMEEKL